MTNLSYQIFYAFILLLTTLPTQAQWITHDLGKTWIDGTPKRIIALNWSQTEMLLTLGITPIGVTDIKGYRYWQSNHPPLPDHSYQGKDSLVPVVEVGHRGTPSLQAIIDLKPDLIIGYSFRHAKLYSQLQTIAPTLIFNQYPNVDDDRDYFQRMQTIFSQLALAVGKEEQANMVTHNMFMQLDIAKKRIIAHQRQGEKTIFGKFVGMGMGLRVYSDQSLPGSIMQKIGLKNGWKKGLPGRDFTHLQLSQLAQLGQSNLIYVGNLHKEGRQIITSPVWQRLPFVQQHRLYASPQLWSFGGPISAIRMAQAITEALTGQPLKTYQAKL